MPQIFEIVSIGAPAPEIALFSFAPGALCAVAAAGRSIFLAADCKDNGARQNGGENNYERMKQKVNDELRNDVRNKMLENTATDAYTSRFCRRHKLLLAERKNLTADNARYSDPAQKT